MPWSIWMVMRKMDLYCENKRVKLEENRMGAICEVEFPRWELRITEVTILSFRRVLAVGLEELVGDEARRSRHNDDFTSFFSLPVRSFGCFFRWSLYCRQKEREKHILRIAKKNRFFIVASRRVEKSFHIEIDSICVWNRWRRERWEASIDCFKNHLTSFAWMSINARILWTRQTRYRSD